MIGISEQGIVDLERALEKLEKAASDLTPVWPKVGNWWRARQLAVFASSGRGTWETQKSPQGSRGILVRTGQLRNAVSSPRPISASPTSAAFGATGRAGWYAASFTSWAQAEFLCVSPCCPLMGVTPRTFWRSSQSTLRRP